MRKYKLLLSAALLVTVSVVGYTGLARAHDFRGGSHVVVESNQKIDHTLFVAGNNVDISSEVFGDVFCGGQTINISGKVHGDVICGGQTINISGDVDGDVRLAGQSISVDGDVKGNATIAGQSFTLSSPAKIEGDVTLGSADGTFHGSVGRDIAVSGGSVVIAGSVGRDMTGNIENLQLANGARVQGNIDFTSNKGIEKADGAVVGGKITRSDAPRHGESKRGAIFGFGIIWFLYIFLAMLVMALALALLFPRLLHNVTDRAIPRPWKALLTGFLASLAVPMILLALGFSVIGLPLALLAGLLWVVVMLLSGPVFGYYLGRLVLPDSQRPLLIMLLGASVLLVLYFLPIIGLVALVVAFWGGSGMLLLELFHTTPRPAYNLAATPLAPNTKKK